MSDDVIDFEEHWSPDRLKVYERNPTVRHRLRYILHATKGELAASDQRVFDYGCGSGHILETLQQRYGLVPERIWGCDLSPQAIRVAEERTGSHHLFCEPFPSLRERFRTVVCSEVLEHIPEYQDVLAWIASHQDAGGSLVITSPCGRLDPPDAWYGHVRHFRLSELCGVLEGLGYLIEQSREWGFPLVSLQRAITKRYFDAVRDKVIEKTLSPVTRLIFDISYCAYFVHDLIPLGSQLFLKARKA
jgi:predicted TPR repeat methyltransferase